MVLPGGTRDEEDHSQGSLYYVKGSQTREGRNNTTVGVLRDRERGPT